MTTQVAAPTGRTSTVTVNTAVDVPVLELLDVSLSARAVALPEQE